MNARKIAGTLVAAGLAVGLLGAGISAQWTDSATATGRAQVGTFGCTVSSTDPNVIIDGNSVASITLPPILSGAPGSAYVSNVTVSNDGSIPELVHWTFATGGTLAADQWQPAGAFGYATGTQADSMTTDVTLAVGASHTYGSGGVGFIWTGIDNAYLSKTASVTYTANCSEVPAPTAVTPVAPTVVNQTCSASGAIVIPSVTGIDYFLDGAAVGAGSRNVSVTGHIVTANARPGFVLTGYPAGGWSLTVSPAVCPISFVGVASANSSSVSLPASWLPGDIAIVMATNPASNVVPTLASGWTSLSTVTTGTNNMASHLGSRVLQPGDTTTGSWASATRVLVLVYRNVASIGGFASYAQSNTQAYVTVPGISPLQVTNGKSWVAGVAACKSGTCKSAYFGNGVNVVTRTSGATSNSMLGTDTNSGVSTWAPHVSGGTGSSPSNGFSVELKAIP